MTNHSEQSSLARVVIVGGGYAGVLAALRASRRLRGRAEVVLVDPRPHLVERVRVHEQVASGRTITHPYAALLAGSGVRFMQGWASAIDLAGQTLRVGERVVGFDRLLLTVGSAVARESIPGVEAHALALDPERGEALRAAVLALADRGGRVLVCGGGLTGIELAAELAEAHPRLELALATRGELGAMVSEAGREYLRATLVRLGVTLHEGTILERLDAGLARRHGASDLGFDLCVWAGGFTASPLLRASGLRVDERGAALVDPYLRALGHPHVFVAGDAAALPLPERPDTPLPMGCKTALPLAAHAADNLAASLHERPLAPFDYADAVLCISLGRRDALLQAMPGARPGKLLARGRLAAWIKERICRYTIHVLHWQRRGIDMWWAKSGRVHTPALVESRVEAAR